MHYAQAEMVKATDLIRKYFQIFNDNKCGINGVLANGAEFPADKKVDPEIRDIIDLINTLPFIYTESSCSGHKYTRGQILEEFSDIDEGELQCLPSNNECCYWTGYLAFVVIPTAGAGRFVNDLRAIGARFGDTYLTSEWDPIIKIDDPSINNLRYTFFFEDPRSQMYLMNIEEAKKCDTVRKAVISEVQSLVTNYAERYVPHD
jgi:hypothetical protein